MPLKNQRDEFWVFITFVSIIMYYLVSRIRFYIMVEISKEMIQVNLQNRNLQDTFNRQGNGGPDVWWLPSNQRFWNLNWIKVSWVWNGLCTCKCDGFVSSVPKKGLQSLSLPLWKQQKKLLKYLSRKSVWWLVIYLKPLSTDDSLSLNILVSADFSRTDPWREGWLLVKAPETLVSFA